MRVKYFETIFNMYISIESCVDYDDCQLNLLLSCRCTPGWKFVPFFQHTGIWPRKCCSETLYSWLLFRVVIQLIAVQSRYIA